MNIELKKVKLLECRKKVIEQDKYDMIPTKRVYNYFVK